MNATFPMKTMRFSAIWKTSTAHKKCSGFGYKHTDHKDYPTDLVGADTGRDWFYAPCDVVCLRVYSKASHCLWFRSVDKVEMPIGYGYLYFMVEHMSTDGFVRGRRFSKGTKMFREGRAGNASGNHLHVSCGFAKDKSKVSFGTGWTRNNHGAWVLHIKGVKNIKIQSAFYLDDDFTHVMDKRIKFRKEPEPFKVGKTYKLKANMNVRKGAGTAFKKTGVILKGKSVKALAIKKTGTSYWIKIKKNRWICAKREGKVYVK